MASSPHPIPTASRKVSYSNGMLQLALAYRTLLELILCVLLSRAKDIYLCLQIDSNSDDFCGLIVRFWYTHTLLNQVS